MHAVNPQRVGGVFGVLIVLVLQVQLLYGQENLICKLEISRGNVRSLLVRVDCPNQDPSESLNATWEYKLSLNESWKPLTKVGIHRHIKTVYFLKGLLPATLYYVRAFIPRLGKYTAMMESWTCSITPPPVVALREGGAGPGWLDVRWQRPRETCGSILTFLVRYNVVDLPLGPEKVFGIIDTHVGYASVNPAHPCSNSEFCVLFTDRVLPGRKHIVEVRTKRYDSEDHAVGEPQRITLLAVAEVAEFRGNEEAVRRAGNAKEHRHPMDFLLKAVVLPLWILLLVGGMSFILLLIAFICCCTSFRRKNSLTSNNTYGLIRIEEMPTSLSLSVTHIYDYPQLPLKKQNTTLCC